MHCETIDDPNQLFRDDTRESVAKAPVTLFIPDQLPAARDKHAAKLRHQMLGRTALTKEATASGRLRLDASLQRNMQTEEIKSKHLLKPSPVLPATAQCVKGAAQRDRHGRSAPCGSCCAFGEDRKRTWS